jgi:hypothetical protein
MIRRSKMKLPEAFSLLETARAGAPVPALNRLSDRRCRRTKGRALLADNVLWHEIAVDPKISVAPERTR